MIQQTLVGNHRRTKKKYSRGTALDPSLIHLDVLRFYRFKLPLSPYPFQLADCSNADSLVQFLVKHRHSTVPLSC